MFRNTLTKSLISEYIFSGVLKVSYFGLKHMFISRNKFMAYAHRFIVTYEQFFMGGVLGASR